MPDLLGETNPVPGYDNTINNRNIQISPGSSQVQNVPDLDKVTGADHRTEQQDASHAGSQIRYDSNFQTFIQQLRQTQDLSSTLSKLMMKEGMSVTSGMSEGIAEEMAQALQMLKMDQAELLKFLAAQMKAGTRFGGALFALLRNAYARASSDGVRADILQFLRNYADFGATVHIEGNILRNLADMVENGMAAGDRKGNLELLQRGIFPYMGGYVERTHDLGLPRTLLTMLALNMARYENGSEEKLLESFHQLSGYGTLKGQLENIDDESLLRLLRSSQLGQNEPAIQFSDHIAAAAARALRGEGGAEVQQAFQNLVGAMLVNESVYMPVNHYLIPLEWNGRMLFSELWVDPDAEDRQSRSGGKGNVMKFLFKMDVQSLGLFDIVLTAQDGEVDLQIACPEKVVPFSQQIETTVSQILARNDLRPSRVAVRKLERPVTLTEVFPKIFEGKNSVNVKV